MTLAVAHGEGRNLVVGTHGRLANLDLEDGDIRWQIKIPKLPGSMTTQPAIALAEDRVFTCSGGFAFAVSLTTGDITWERDLGVLGSRDNGSVAVHRGRLFVATCRHVAALDAVEGSTLWCTHLPGLRQYFPALLVEPTSESLTVAGGCYVCSLSMLDGALRGRDSDLAAVSKNAKVASIASICSTTTPNDPHASPSAQVAAVLRDLCQFGHRDSGLCRNDCSRSM